MPARRHLTALLVAAAVLTACGDGDARTQAADASPTTAAATPAVTADDATSAPVPEALDWVAPDLRGGDVVGADLAGQDVVLWFWAPW